MSSQTGNFGDLIRRLGGVAPHRVRLQPAPGTATVADVQPIHENEGILCELIDGVLVEKAVGYAQSQLAVYLASLLTVFVNPRNLGIVTGPDGTMELMPDLIRIPDVAFTRWDRMPGRRRPTAPIPHLVPNLAVEVHSPGNTPAEMAAKREDYFRTGVELVWELDLERRIVNVCTAPADAVMYGVADELDGGTVLPGLHIAVRDLFAELDRQG